MRGVIYERPSISTKKNEALKNIFNSMGIFLDSHQKFTGTQTQKLYSKPILIIAIMCSNLGPKTTLQHI